MITFTRPGHFLHSLSFLGNSGSWNGFPGQFSSSFDRKFGLWSHSFNLRGSEPFAPLDAMSAGFPQVSTCRHWRGVDSSCIVATLLATNVWNLLDSLRMYYKTTVESVQQVVSCIGYSNLFRIRQFNFTATTATPNSRRGMDTTFRGITRDLPRTNEQFGTPLSPTIRRYHTTPQPFADASEK